MRPENFDNTTGIIGGFTSSKTDNKEVSLRSIYNEDNVAVKEEQKRTDTTESQKANIGDVNVINAFENLHLGTAVTFNGPVHITGITKKDILSINETCGSCRRETEKKDKFFRINKYKIEIGLHGNMELNAVSKYFILVAALLLTQIFILPLCSLIINSWPITSVSESNRCDGIHPNKLKSFFYIYKRPDIKSRTSWGFQSNCVFKCCIKNNKSIVRLSIVRSNLLSNLLDQKYFSPSEFEDELSRQMNNFSTRLNDIYFNYIIGYHDRIIEGRPLTCPFEERLENLKEDHSKIITVGIPYCFSGDTNLVEKYTKTLIKTKNVLLRVLQYRGVLNEKFTLEIPDLCNGTTLLNMMLEDKLTKNTLKFYDYYENAPFSDEVIQSYVQIASDISFASIDEGNFSNSKNLTDLSDSMNFPISLSNTTDCEYQTEFLNLSNTKDYYKIFEFRSLSPPLPSKQNNNNFDKIMDYCRTIALSTEKFNNSFNYFVCKENIVFKDSPTECLPSFQKFFDSKGNYKNVIGSRLIINTINIMSDDVVLNIFSFLHFLQAVINDQRESNSFLNSCMKQQLCDVKYVFLFDCPQFREPVIFKLYELFHFDVMFQVEEKYWFTSYEKCLRFRRRLFTKINLLNSNSTPGVV